MADDTELALYKLDQVVEVGQYDPKVYPKYTHSWYKATVCRIRNTKTGFEYKVKFRGYAQAEDRWMPERCLRYPRKRDERDKILPKRDVEVKASPYTDEPAAWWEAKVKEVNGDMVSVKFKNDAVNKIALMRKPHPRADVRLSSRERAKTRAVVTASPAATLADRGFDPITWAQLANPPPYTRVQVVRKEQVHPLVYKRYEENMQQRKSGKKPVVEIRRTTRKKLRNHPDPPMEQVIAAVFDGCLLDGVTLGRITDPANPVLMMADPEEAVHGVFATKDIPGGSVVQTYAGLVRHVDEFERSITPENEHLQTYSFDLHSTADWSEVRQAAGPDGNVSGKMLLIDACSMRVRAPFSSAFLACATALTCGAHAHPRHRVALHARAHSLPSDRAGNRKLTHPLQPELHLCCSMQAQPVLGMETRELAKFLFISVCF
eukprot:TRINITY_DN14642_c0_g1_i1.p2 TRINITY_DN14642_c0_g1~~TRINITY_DN14642_c0_g1_i1.p2  ORF type:complete len:433 (+),score=84.69 TRINITY_DN14642_c0_g1_i1:145-1443(+)